MWLLCAFWKVPNLTTTETVIVKQQHKFAHVTIVINDDVVDLVDSTNMSKHDVLIRKVLKLFKGRSRATGKPVFDMF
jgi:hypothetical protein